MRPETASQTALGTAIGRALESNRAKADRLFEDQFAEEFLPLLQRVLLHLLQLPILGPALLSLRERQIPGIMGNLLCRTRFLDDTLRDALKHGFRQVVILGAGFDSRADRISGMDQVRVFEVDHPATQSRKRSWIQHRKNGTPSHVTFVPIDFERRALGEAMAAADFDMSARTFVIWEGVTQYIPAAAVEATLEYLAQLKPGSRIAFTYVHRGLIDGSAPMDGAQKLMAQLARYGEPWRFGIDPSSLRGYLAGHRLRLVADVGATEYRTRYLEPLDRKMNLFAGERIAIAEVVGPEGEEVVLGPSATPERPPKELNDVEE